MLNRWKQQTVTLLYRTAKKCVQMVPSRVLRFRPFHIYEISLTPHPAENGQGAGSAPVRVAWIASHEELAGLANLADPVNLEAWDGTTRRAAIAWKNDQPVGIAWIATESFAEPELGLSYRLRPDEAWLFAAVVETEYRRRGVYSALMQFVIDELTGEGVQRLLLGISTGNEASLAAHRRFGAVPLGSILAARCLGVGYCRTKGGVTRKSNALVWGREHELKLDCN